MSLDLTRVVSQVITMITGLKDGRKERQKRLDFALATIGNPAIDLEKLRKKIIASRTSWLVAELVDGLEKRYPAPAIPTDITVIASDGSHIDVDRHRPNRCYLINIGTVVLTYGSKFEAILSSTPQLYADEKDLTITPPGEAASSLSKVIYWASSGPPRNAIPWSRQLQDYPIRAIAWRCLTVRLSYGD